jgi:hypothetical protein
MRFDTIELRFTKKFFSHALESIAKSDLLLHYHWTDAKAVTKYYSLCFVKVY